MIASSAGRNRSFWRSSRGLATASPNADDPPPIRTNRAKRESQIARNPAPLLSFPAKSITSLDAFRRAPQRSRDSSRTTLYSLAAWLDASVAAGERPRGTLEQGKGACAHAIG